jgi:hypothetical protein
MKLHKCRKNQDGYYDDRVAYDDNHKEWLLQIPIDIDSFDDLYGHVDTSINYCPFCGEKLEVK